MTEVLWRWPESARVGRIVPKTKFYERTRASAKLRAAFVDEVERITWAYKLSASTLGLAGDEFVPEIQVFVVEAKPGRVVSTQVLAAIDGTVHTPIVFEEHGDSDSGARIRTRAAYKRPGPRGPVVADLLDGDWLPSVSTRAPLPAALDLAGLYARLFTPLLPLTPRLGESLPSALERAAQAKRLAREVESLERRMRVEPQPNRKLEVRRELRARMAEYETVVAEAT